MAPSPWVEELHFPHLEIPVAVSHIGLVMPARTVPAPPGHTLYLSNLDDMIGARVFTPTVYFYPCLCPSSRQKQPVVARILRDALASVLVPYYPFAGRIREAENGKLEVFFGQEQGALMVEAHSEMALSSLGDLTVPNPAWLPLVYFCPGEEPYRLVDMPLLIAQVTTFSCGGFSLGLRLCHCLCDGFGAMQFIRAWAATAKAGTLVANPAPCWEREFLKPRDPPIIKYPHLEFMRIDEGSSLTMSLWQKKPIQKCYRIRPEFQALVKALSQPSGSGCGGGDGDGDGDGDGGNCTTFDAMAAHVWRSWVKALDVQPLDYNLRLTFSVNARRQVRDPPLREGFYGNVVCVACATSSVSGLVDGRLPDAARLVREARLSVSEEYLRSTLDYLEVSRPRRLEFGGKLTITQWTRFPIYESADFGWGRPVYAGTIDLTLTPQVCVFLPEGGSQSTGTMVVCICLPEYASDRFTKHLSTVLDSKS